MSEPPAAQCSPLSADLDEILERTGDLWQALRGARLFITGGTGFFGTWLTESLVHADSKLGLGLKAVLLSRDEGAFLRRHPHLAGAPNLEFLRGDVRDFDFPKDNFSHVICAAAESSARLDSEQPELMREVIVTGTSRALRLAKACGAQRLLFISSGAVYGRQRPEITHVSEDDPGLQSPLQTRSAYAEGKRQAERLCLDSGLPVVIARGFAFVGPHMPLDAHFAVGNFIRDALRGGPIEVQGDGTPYRSYLYASDLATWLWTILLKGIPGKAYNVGSERRLSIAELARIAAAQVAPRTDVRVAKKAVPAAQIEQYVPSTRRAREELGLRETVSLEEALRRTAAWAKSR